MHVLAALDEQSYSPRAPMVDHPIAWSSPVGQGAALYTGGGHTPESFDEPLFRQHLTQSLQFVLADGWIDLIGSGLEGWHPPGNWAQVGSVALDSQDASRMQSTPGTGVLWNGPGGRTTDLISHDTFGDCEIHLEWMMAQGSNSGPIR